MNATCKLLPFIQKSTDCRIMVVSHSVTQQIPEGELKLSQALTGTSRWRLRKASIEIPVKTTERICPESAVKRWQHKDNIAHCLEEDKKEAHTCTSITVLPLQQSKTCKDAESTEVMQRFRNNPDKISRNLHAETSIDRSTHHSAHSTKANGSQPLEQRVSDHQSRRRARWPRSWKEGGDGKIVKQQNKNLKGGKGIQVSNKQNVFHSTWTAISNLWQSFQSV